MKEKMKLDLTRLEVRSFVTQMADDSERRVVGASGGNCPQARESLPLTNCCPSRVTCVFLCPSDPPMYC